MAERLAELAFSLDPDERRALQVASGAARFFDVEDALGEELVQAETNARRPAPRRVAYPTQLLAFDATSSLDELHNFVISRPGVANVVLDLASNRQLVTQLPRGGAAAKGRRPSARRRCASTCSTPPARCTAPGRASATPS